MVLKQTTTPTDEAKMFSILKEILLQQKLPKGYYFKTFPLSKWGIDIPNGFVSINQRNEKKGFLRCDYEVGRIYLRGRLGNKRKIKVIICSKIAYDKLLPLFKNLDAEIEYEFGELPWDFVSGAIGDTTTNTNWWI